MQSRCIFGEQTLRRSRLCSQIRRLCLKCIAYAPINVTPGVGWGGGNLGICGAFDALEELLFKIPTIGPEKCINVVQCNIHTTPTKCSVPSIYIEIE